MGKKPKRSHGVKVGPPIARVLLMYPDSDNVLRVLRSAGGALVFGPASKGASDVRYTFTFDKHLDPHYRSGMPVYAVIWKYFDNGLVTQQVSFEPIKLSSPFWHKWNVDMSLKVGLDKRQWVDA